MAFPTKTISVSVLEVEQHLNKDGIKQKLANVLCITCSLSLTVSVTHKYDTLLVT